MSRTTVNTQEIRAARARAGLSQRVLGEALGLGQNQYSRRERGLVAFKDSERLRMKEILNMDDPLFLLCFFNL